MKTSVDKDGPLAKVADDGIKLASEVSHGLISQILKDKLFNRIEK